jgi:quercetin dioxygenase-like cupin family protein
VSRMRIVMVGIAVFGSACALGITAIGQQAPPTENRGVSVGKTTAFDLGPEIQGMQGRQLRSRVITVEPGGHIREHSHNDWPGVVYVLQGVVIEYEGGRTNEYRVGEMFSEKKETTHWLENKGTTPAVIIVTDIFKQP